MRCITRAQDDVCACMWFVQQNGHIFESAHAFVVCVRKGGSEHTRNQRERGRERDRVEMRAPNRPCFHIWLIRRLALVCSRVHACDDISNIPLRPRQLLTSSQVRSCILTMSYAYCYANMLHKNEVCASCKRLKTESAPSKSKKSATATLTSRYLQADLYTDIVVSPGVPSTSVSMGLDARYEDRRTSDGGLFASGGVPYGEPHREHVSRGSKENGAVGSFALAVVLRRRVMSCMKQCIYVHACRG
jgi:hypothetical protein